MPLVQECRGRGRGGRGGLSHGTKEIKKKRVGWWSVTRQFGSGDVTDPLQHNFTAVVTRGNRVDV
jgi:hypothetical protein